MITKYWTNLNPKHKRLLVIASVSSAFFLSLYLAVKDDQPTNTQVSHNDKQLQILATRRLDDFTLASLSNTVDSLKHELAQQQELSKSLQQQLGQLKKEQQQPTTNIQPTNTSSLDNSTPNLVTSNTSQLTADGDSIVDRTAELNDLMELLAGLPQEQQCQVYYNFISKHPQSRNTNIERLINFDEHKYDKAGILAKSDVKDSANTSSDNKSTITSGRLDPLKDFTVPNSKVSDIQQPDSDVSTDANNSNVDFTTHGNVNNSLAQRYYQQQAQQPHQNPTPSASNQAPTWDNQVQFQPPPTNYSSNDVGNYSYAQYGNLANGNNQSYGATTTPLKIRTISSTVVDPVNPDINIPAGAVFTGTLVTGVDAPTNDGAKADPYPVLIKLNNLDFLPNEYATDLASCFVLMSSYGDMSSQRALMRTQSLSCVNQQGYILEGAIKGYVVGNDGKIGIAGRLVSKQGSLIAKSLSVGFLQGIGNALSHPNIVINNDKFSAGDVLKQAGLNGAGTALNRVANFYLSLASKMFPLVEVEAGRKIDIVLTAPVSLQASNRKVTRTPLEVHATPATPIATSEVHHFSVGATTASP